MENKGVDNAEKSLNLSLSIFKGSPDEAAYVARSIAVFNDSIMVKFDDISFRVFNDSLYRRVKEKYENCSTASNCFEYRLEVKKMIDDSLIYVCSNEYRDKLKDEQFLEIKKMVSELIQKYDLSTNLLSKEGGRILKVDKQIYYRDNVPAIGKQIFCRDSLHMLKYPRTKEFCPPEEVMLLIEYIVDLSPHAVIYTCYY